MKKWLIIASALMISGAAAAYYAVPWNNILQQNITAFLNDKGLQNVSFTINSVGLQEATLSDIVIGDKEPLRLQSLNVQYDLRELIKRNLQDLTLTGLDIQILQTDKGWTVAGIDGLKGNDTGSNDLLSLSQIIDTLPFSAIHVEESHLRISGKAVQTALPFRMSLTRNPETKLQVVINASTLMAASTNIPLGNIAVEAKPDDAGNWTGTWNAASVDFGKNFTVPVLKGGGDISYASSSIEIDGLLSSADKSHTIDFLINMDTAQPSKNRVTIRSASLPFKEGRISTRNAVIPFDRSKNIIVNATADKVSLNALMQTLTGEKVTATGTVSGNIPVILRPNGTYSLGQGTLKADNAGLIQMPGNLIPGDNEQVKLVRQILENLHYSLFSAVVDTSGADGLIVRLSLEGNNPDVYNGRPVKLNVNLTGDVLDFIQQNAMLITSPEKFLRQESYE